MMNTVLLPSFRSTSRCSTSRTRTARTSSSGSPTTSRRRSATSPRAVSRCPPPSSATARPSRSCSSASQSSSPPCSAARPSSTGTSSTLSTRHHHYYPYQSIRAYLPFFSQSKDSVRDALAARTNKTMTHTQQAKSNCQGGSNTCQPLAEKPVRKMNLLRRKEMSFKKSMKSSNRSTSTA